MSMSRTDSKFSRVAVASITAAFLIIVFAYRQYQIAQSFELIGVVEGFYGSPWSHDERLDMVRFMGDVGMNAYFYAPKDDPFHRQNWRDPYTGDHLERFQELVEVSAVSNVMLYYAISPGLSIKYSSDDDYIALKNKLLSMVELGVRHIALFLDDVPEYLQHEADKEAFANLGEAHVALVNRLYADLDAIGVNLIVCPTTYTAAWGDRDYVQILGDGIPEHIKLFWTGNDVAVGTITTEDATEWGELMSRNPLIWDNFPVNDFEVWRPIVGPLTGRDPKLANTTTGIIANPMDAPYLSMISLYTVADYAKRPFSYDEKRSWQDALIHLAGAEGARALRPLALLYADYGWTDNIFTPLYTPGKLFEINVIRDALQTFDETLDRLRSEDFSENTYIQNIIPELEPFAKQTRERFESMVNNRFYRVDPEGFLVFRRELEEILALDVPVTLDGNLNEWGRNEFKPLKPSVATEGYRVEAAFRTQNHVLYVGIRVQTDTLFAPNMNTWVGGDQILFALEFTPSNRETWIQPTDLLIQVRPPLNPSLNNIVAPTVTSSEVLKGSFYLTPFSQRGISDITMRTISSFFDHFVGDVHPTLQGISDGIEVKSRRTRSGYEVEVAIPVPSLSEINIAISVNDAVKSGSHVRNVNFMLGERPYIGNRNTYVPIILK